MGPIRTAIREFIDNRPERVARRREFLRDLLNPLDVIGETDRQQGVEVERRPIRRMIQNLSGIGGRIERGDPLMDVMTGSPSTTAPASTVQPAQKSAPPKVNEVIGDEEPTAPLTFPAGQFQQTSSSMPVVRSARQSEPEGMPPRPSGRPFTMDELVMMARTNRLASPDGQQQFVGLSSIANRELERDKLDADTAKARQQYELDRQKLALTGEQINGELGLGSRKVDNEATDISNRLNLGLGETRVKELMAGTDRFRADNDLTLGLAKLANETFDIQSRTGVQNRQVDVDAGRLGLERDKEEKGAYLSSGATRSAAGDVYSGKTTLRTYKNNYKRENSAAVGTTGVMAEDDDAIIEVKDAGYLAAADEMKAYFDGDESSVKGGRSGLTNRIRRFIREVHGEQIKLSLIGGTSAPTLGNQAGVKFPKLPPREIANMVTTEAISYMNVPPNSEEAQMLATIVDEMVIPKPAATAKQPARSVPAFKQ